MGDAIGSGTPHVKIEVAKQAAITALGRAAQSGAVEVAVLAFSGDCQNPVPRYQDFTRDVTQLTRFISSLQPGGGTPMADVLRFANRYMATNGNAGASNRMIMLLADGQNDCGDIGQALASVQASGLIFRHETVGFGITPTSQAAQDSRAIATQTGGTYHHAVDATQLADVFMEFVDTFSVIDLLGQFGSNAPAPPSGSPSQKTGHQPPANTGGLTGLLGSFKAPSPAPGGKKAPPPKPPLHGAFGHRRESRAVVGLGDRLSDNPGGGAASARRVRRHLPHRDVIQQRMWGLCCRPGAGQNELWLGAGL